MGRHISATLDTSCLIATEGGKEILAGLPWPYLVSSIHDAPIHSRSRATDKTRKDL